jgi:ABC-type lipoprotein export system ATPase subunit
MNELVLEVQNLVKEFNTPAGSFKALADVTFQAKKGEFIAITGESGSGKSTLLNLISGIDVPTTGIVKVNDDPINEKDEEGRNRWRGKNVGIVFQFFQLIPTLLYIPDPKPITSYVLI